MENLEKDLISVLEIIDLENKVKVYCESMKKEFLVYSLAMAIKEFGVARIALNKCFKFVDEMKNEVHQAVSKQKESVIDAYLDSGVEKSIKECVEQLRQEEKRLNEIERV